MWFSIIMILISAAGIILWVLPNAWNRPPMQIGSKADVIILLAAVPCLLIFLFI